MKNLDNVYPDIGPVSTTYRLDDGTEFNFERNFIRFKITMPYNLDIKTLLGYVFVVSINPQFLMWITGIQKERANPLVTTWTVVEGFLIPQGGV